MIKEKPVPKLSILMPFKNSGQYISDSIQSILDQDFNNWELIAVDDHSEDHSNSLVENFAANYPNIHLLRNKGNGIIDALKTAYNKASGTFISRMDSDDLMPAGRLTKMVKALKDAPEKTIVTGKVKYFSDDEVSKGYRDYQNWLNQRVELNDHWKWIYRECVIASPNWMARKDELDAISAFSEANYPEDYDLVFKWYAAGFNIRSIPEATLHWREHPQRTSRNSIHYSQEYFFRLKLDYFLQLDYSQNGLILLGAGEKGKIAAKFLVEHEINFQWMEQDPKLIGQVIDGVKVAAFDVALLKPPTQVLVAVYPEEKERKVIAEVLDGCGVEWWWL